MDVHGGSSVSVSGAWRTAIAVAACKGRRILLIVALAVCQLPVPGAGAQSQGPSAPVATSVAAPVRQSDQQPGQACPEPWIEAAPVRGGLTRIAIDTPCRAQQLVTFTYAESVFIRWLDARGRTDLMLDCF